MPGVISVAEMREIVLELHQIWLAFDPLMVVELRDAASEDEIAATESELGVQFPESLRNLYLNFDGGWIFPHSSEISPLGNLAWQRGSLDELWEERFDYPAPAGYICFSYGGFFNICDATDPEDDRLLRWDVQSDEGLSAHAPSFEAWSRLHLAYARRFRNNPEITSPAHDAQTHEKREFLIEHGVCSDSGPIYFP